MLLLAVLIGILTLALAAPVPQTAAEMGKPIWDKAGWLPEGDKTYELRELERHDLIVTSNRLGELMMTYSHGRNGNRLMLSTFHDIYQTIDAHVASLDKAKELAVSIKQSVHDAAEKLSTDEGNLPAYPCDPFDGCR